MGGPGSGRKPGSGPKHMAKKTTFQKSRMKVAGVKVKKIRQLYKGGEHGVKKGLYLF